MVGQRVIAFNHTSLGGSFHGNFAYQAKKIFVLRRADENEGKLEEDLESGLDLNSELLNESS